MPGNQLSSQYGAYIPTTFVWDISQIYSLDVKSPEFKELIVKLYQNMNLMAQVLNVKDTGQYTNEFEVVNGQLWFPNPANTSATAQVAAQRNVFRTVINFGALPNAGTKSIPHNINPNTSFSFTRIYGAATNPTGGSLSYIPIPYASATAVVDNIELYVDATNVNITTGANYSAYTIVYIILEYIKM